MGAICANFKKASASFTSRTATGGIPNTAILQNGNDLVISTWDLISGAVKPGLQVLIYDDNGNHPGMQAAELVAAAGTELEVVTPERMFAPELASGRVRRILRDWRLPSIDLWAAFPTGRKVSAKARAFTDFIEQALSEELPIEAAGHDLGRH